ncbi:unnamed protein product [Cylicocyclus nassatus]|uniref:C3H1-type domain-containing protein n=1 Tax=Cylicocyclus nassatus TaxID=53992 RepID=A0AA36DQU5_CYLNA|nr:unnamed protein product [Cylicocyclus nassatus]
MALNLISSYDSDDDTDSIGSEPVDKSTTDTVKPEEALSSEKKSSFFFGGEESGSSDDDGDNQSKNISEPSEKPNSGTRRLPSAMSVLKGKHAGSSVFSSEREQEDLAQQFTLSQHVPLTEKVETKKKPVCRAFQRGECRRGNKCRFAHPTAPQVPRDAATMADAPRMYNADDIFAKKAKIA